MRSKPSHTSGSVAKIILGNIVVCAIVAGAVYYETKHGQPTKIVREKCHCKKLADHGYQKCCENCKCLD